MILPEELHYSKLHTWLSLEEKKTGAVGVTRFAVLERGEIKSFVLPCTGDGWMIKILG